MHIAIVTAAYRSNQDEKSLFLRRLAGVLALSHDVTILAADSPLTYETVDGAVKVRHFASELFSNTQRESVQRLSMGIRRDMDPCECMVQRNALLPRVLGEVLAKVAGGFSSQLLDHLGKPQYDLVAFAGYSSASSYFGMHALSQHTPFILIPQVDSTLVMSSPLFGPLFEHSIKIIVATEAERRLVNNRLRSVDSNRVINVGFVISIGGLGFDPDAEFSDEPFVGIVSDFNGDHASWSTLRMANLLAGELIEPRVLLIGIGWEGVIKSPYLRAVRPTARPDVWRQMNQAIAVIDPIKYRFLGREVLESFLCQTPVLVRAEGGASREHAERGGGGLWFRNFSELLETLRVICDSGVRTRLASSGEKYALSTYTDKERFISAVLSVFAT